METIINLEVTQGWGVNDSDQRIYYVDGSMAVNTKIDGYEVGLDRARKDNN